MLKQRVPWIVLGALVCLGVVVLVPALPLEYIPVPDFELPDVAEKTIRRYRSEADDGYVFYVEEARYFIADSSFGNEAELGNYLDAQTTLAGWTSNSTLSFPIRSFCYRVTQTTDLSEWSIRVYVSNKFIESRAMNLWAAPHLCITARHHAQSHQYEILVATFNPTLLSALTD